MTKTKAAIALMIVAMASFAIGDAMIKRAAQTMPVIEVILIVTVLCMGIFWSLAAWRGDPIFSPLFFDRGVLLRNAAEALAVITFSTALSLAPLVQVIAIAQSVPLLVTLGAVFILGEKVGPRRWAAILIGLAGVLIMLQPGAGVTWGEALAFIGACGLALRDIFTRLASPHASVPQLSVWAMIAVLAAALPLLALTGGATLPTATNTPYLIAAAFAGGIAYLTITQSVRMAPVSVVIPFRYTRLLFGTALGVWLFGERLTPSTILGSALVVAAGLFVLHIERRKAPLLHRSKPG